MEWIPKMMDFSFGRNSEQVRIDWDDEEMA